jgi:hypothetical protein
MAEIINFSYSVLAHELFEIQVWQDTSQDGNLKICERRYVIMIRSDSRRAFNSKITVNCLHEEWKEVADLDEREDSDRIIFIIFIIFGTAGN